METRTTMRRYFESMDLVRGIAACAVLVYHIDFMFGMRHRLLPGGYLAVDLFFVLSGFVLSLNYQDAIASGGITFRKYLMARLARLYPLFVATTVIGFVVMTARHKANYGYFDMAALVKSAALNVAMLPSFAAAYGTGTLFIFNPATWSIFFEMVASVLFFACLARMRTQALVLLLAGAAAALGATIIRFGTADLGYATENIWAGFARVTFSFVAGMLVYRLYRRRPWRCPRVVYYLAIAAVVGSMQAKLHFPYPPWLDMAAIGLLLPALVAVSAGVSLTGIEAGAARFLGETSYAVYLTQGSLIIIAAGLSQSLVGEKIYDLGAWVGFAFVTVTLAVSFLTYRFFEQPARLFLRHLGSGERMQAEQVRSQI
jgi:peptidoglycan/LPS O-acetylase OafA/YrhL